MIYPPEIYHGTADQNTTLEKISTPLQKYLSSTVSPTLKFVPLLQAHSLRAPYPGFPAGLPANTTDGGAYLAQWASYVQALVDDPRCLRLNGVPVVGMYLSSVMPDPMWATFKTALNRTIVLVDWNRDTTNGTRLGASIATEYPPNPGFPGGAGQHAYSEQAAIDVGYNSPVGFLTTGLISTIQDSRPRNTAHSFVDQPTQPEFYNHAWAQMRAVASGVHTTLTIVHAWNERAEDGPAIEPSVQEGTRYLDAIMWAKNPSTKPSSYTYGIAARNLTFVKTGAGWTSSLALGTAAWNNEKVSDSTASDTATLTHVKWLSARIFGATCASCGTFNLQLDGAAAAVIPTSGATAEHQMLQSFVFNGATATHTMLITINGTGPVNLDEIEVTYDPR